MTEFLPFMFLSLAAGLACGFLSSSPLGSINLWIISRVLDRNKNTRHMRAYLTGVISADLAYATMAVWGYRTLSADTTADRWLAGIGGAFLVLMGLLTLRVPRDRPAKPMSTGGTSALRHWLLGAFMCGSNPGFLLFWIFAIDQMEHYLTLRISGNTLLPFLIGIAAGDMLWFFLLVKWTRRLRTVMSTGLTRRINVAVGVVFIALGGFGIFRII